MDSSNDTGGVMAGLEATCNAKKWRWRFPTLLIIMSLTACSSTPPPSTRTGEAIKARFNGEFELRIGQRAEMESGDFSIEFVSVLHDSRCPADVVCIQEGEAEAEVAVRRKDLPVQPFTLSTSRRGRQEQRFDVYTIRLVQLIPWPRTDRPTAESDYGATFLVTRG